MGCRAHAYRPNRETTERSGALGLVLMLSPMSRRVCAFADEGGRERDRLVAVEQALDGPTIAALIDIGVDAG